MLKNVLNSLGKENKKLKGTLNKFKERKHKDDKILEDVLIQVSKNQNPNQNIANKMMMRDREREETIKSLENELLNLTQMLRKLEKIEFKG